ncbi:hypothetical protein F5879DRAFT_938933 [Lentinula edodes]|nr:hypothetical protein F5879DRAFT_938933 [Lentinula edodes]
MSTHGWSILSRTRCRSCCREREVKTCSSSTLRYYILFLKFFYRCKSRSMYPSLISPFFTPSQSLLSSFKSSVSIPSLPTRFSITKQLYTALVDCHLTNGCEIILDANPGLIRILEGVQIRFLRHMLGLSSNFVITPL